MYEYLIHSGVKGMKWGVRHDNKRSNNSYNKRKSNKHNNKNNHSNMLQDTAGFVKAIDNYKRNKAEYEYHTNILKETKNYTDKELKQMTNRLILENNYIMARNNQNKTQNSKVNDILNIVGAGIKMTGSAAITAASIITAINTIKKGIA